MLVVIIVFTKGQNDFYFQTQPASGDREDSELETGVSRILYIQVQNVILFGYVLQILFVVFVSFR